MRSSPDRKLERENCNVAAALLWKGLMVKSSHYRWVYYGLHRLPRPCADLLNSGPHVHSTQKLLLSCMHYSKQSIFISFENKLCLYKASIRLILTYAVPARTSNPSVSLLLRRSTNSSLEVSWKSRDVEISKLKTRSD